jgi:Tol biopolymer transport system component
MRPMILVLLAAAPLRATCGGKLAVIADSGAPAVSPSGGDAGVRLPAIGTLTTGGGPVVDAGDRTPDAPSAPFPGTSGPLTPLDVAACPLPADAASLWIAFDSDRDDVPAPEYVDGGYVTVSGQRDIYLVRADGSQLYRLTNDQSNEEEPAVSNGGDSILFTSDVTGTTQIYKMVFASRAVQELTSLPAGADEPSWSRDDRQIVFHSGPSIYIMASDGSGQRVLGTSQFPANPYEYPSLSPDGTQVVFDGVTEIDAVNVDGTGQRYVVHNTTAIMGMAAVSPDGLSVAFDGTSPPDEQIGVTPLATTALFQDITMVTPGPNESARRPAWGPGTVLAFEHGVPAPPLPIGTAAIAVSTGSGAAPCDIVGGSADNRNPSWAPAGFQPPKL